MIKNKVRAFIVVFVFVAVFYLFISCSSNNVLDIKQIHIAGQNIQVDLALNLETQSQGLSGRKSLDNNKGMLFVFDQPDKYSFWMKDMFFPIDMIWISEDMKVIYIKKDARPELYPEIYKPEENAKYILEVVSGFSEKNNLRVGDTVQFIYRNL